MTTSQNLALIIAVLVFTVVTARAEDTPQEPAQVSAPAPQEASGPLERSLSMPYQPAAPPRNEDIFHVPTGLKVTFEGMMDVLAGDRVVYVGETHDNVHAHRVELAVIRELERRFPKQIAIGMEMFREPQQETLDRWTRGDLQEIEFIKEVKWYENWGSDYGYYREILDFAREHRIDVVALNPASDLQAEVSKTGLDKLPPEISAKLPEMGEPDPFQRESLKAVFGAHLKVEGMLDSYLRVQVLWEETMATRVVNYLRSARGAGKRMIVLSGGWHVRYGFGIPKKVFRRMPAPYAIVAPEEIVVPEEKRGELMNVELPEIPLYSADFYWVVPYEDIETNKVRLGVIIENRDGKVRIKGVQEGSPAEKAGIPEDSDLISLDGRSIAEVSDVIALVGRKQAGDRATVVISKDGVEKTFEVEFFKFPKKSHPKE